MAKKDERDLNQIQKDVEADVAAAKEDLDAVAQDVKDIAQTQETGKEKPSQNRRQKEDS